MLPETRSGADEATFVRPTGARSDRIHQAILDAFHSLLAEGDSRSARGHHDAVRSWLLADPIRVEALLERDWPGVSSLAIGRAFYWRFLQKYRPDLLDRALQHMDCVFIVFLTSLWCRL